MIFDVFTNKESAGIFITLLEALKVKHTKSYSNKYFNEHPYRNTLYGLSKMLSNYQIENQGIRITDKEAMLPNLEPPFIAQTESDFVAVTGVNQENVDYIWRDKKISLSINEFVQHWSGVVLLAETTENSIEPNYANHHKKETFSYLKRVLFIAAVLLFSGLMAFHSQIYTNWKLLVALFINIAGLYICGLLLLKQMHVYSNQADKICSLLKDKSDCNNILETDAAKIMGFSWSEIGLGYFIANILIIIFLPSSYSYVALINICILPYTLWSVWYQKFKAKQWCPLCLIVQFILWLFFLTNLFLGLIAPTTFSLQSLVLTGCVYIISVLIINLLIPVFEGYKKKEAISQQMNGLKLHEEIFNLLLTKKIKYEVSRSDSMILFGDPKAKNRISVVTNPHCNPCAKMHTKLENLLKETDNGYCVEYILTSFSKELEESCCLFINMYQELNAEEYLTFLHEWYDYGKDDRINFYRKYAFDCKNIRIAEEYNKHREWFNKTSITATPTILFNGYELPAEYSIEELRYFCGINMQRNIY